MKKYKQNLNFYYKACNEVADMFAKQYFCDKGMTFTDLELWWVADSIGGVFGINGYYWNMEDMVEALKVGVNRKTIFEYYDWSAEDNPLIINRSLHFYLNLKKLNEK